MELQAISSIYNCNCGSRPIICGRCCCPGAYKSMECMVGFAQGQGMPEAIKI